MGIVDQKHHLPRQASSAGYGKLSNGKLFLIFIYGSGKNPTNYPFVKIINKFLQAIPAVSYLPVFCVWGMDGVDLFFRTGGGSCALWGKMGMEMEIWAEQCWDKVQKISQCWLKRDAPFQWRLFRKASAAMLKFGLQYSPFGNFGQKLMKISGEKILKGL